MDCTYEPSTASTLRERNSLRERATPPRLATAAGGRPSCAAGARRSAASARARAGEGLSNGPYRGAPVCDDVSVVFEVRPAGVRVSASPRGEVRWRSDAYQGHAARGRITEFSARSRSRLRSAAFDLGEFHQPE